MHSLVVAGHPDEVGSWIDLFVHRFLPSAALCVGLLAVIWIACAIIVTAGVYLAGFVVLGARSVRASIRRVRRRGRLDNAHLVTIHPDGVTVTPVAPRRARWCTRPGRSDIPPRSGRSTP